MINRILGGFLTVLAVTVCSASASVTCPSDVNSDNKVDVSDLLMVVNAWGSCQNPCAADVSPPGGNGLVNSEDLLAVIGAWGPCPLCTPQTGCLTATSLWCDNFEHGNFGLWTGGYDNPTTCEGNTFVNSTFHGASHAHRSQVLCSTAESHRGYGGLRFQNDLVVPSFTIPSTGGIDAPNGVVVTMWSRVDCPYTFDTNRWLSLLTCTDDCSNTWIGVVTLNIDDASMRLKPVHVSSVTYAANAPAFARGQWNRITVYINYYTGAMHVWQNGQKVCSATFSRAAHTICQWHFGLYASGPNDNITLYEDDYSIVKLTQPMTNFTAEPRFPSLISPCGIVFP